MVENIKINCPECNVLLNMKNFDKHLSKQHGIYNLSAGQKAKIYRQIEDTKELVGNTNDLQELEELQGKYKKLKIMLSPVPIDKRIKILKSKIAAYNKFNKSIDKETTIISHKKEMKQFSSIVGGILRTENFKRETCTEIGTKEFYEIFIELVPKMIESFLRKKEASNKNQESVKLKAEADDKKLNFNLSQEKIIYGREINQLSNIVGGILKTENIKREIYAEIGTKEFQEMFIELVPEIIESFIRKKVVVNSNQESSDSKIVNDNKKSNSKIFIEKSEIDQEENSPTTEAIIKDKTKIISQESSSNNEIKILDRETYWEENSPIKEPTTIDNVLKHEADTFQYNDVEELDPDMIIDEEQYQEEFINNLSNNKVNIIKTERVVFQKNIVDKEEKDLKSDIKIFLSKMYKGYCQVCGFTFRKLNGENSFEMFNWNDKRVVKVKKSFISTADSLCLCRNCSANIKWGAFNPVFINSIKDIKNFQDMKPDEIKKSLHNLVEQKVPDIFKSLLEFDDMYALEIELRKEARNIYFTNEHLLQFIAYLQTEVEFEKEIILKKEKEKREQISNRVYSGNTWLRREETIPESLARDFVRATAWWLSHPSGPVRAPKHSHNIYNNLQHGWAVDFGANKFLVGKAIERCKNEINSYIEGITNSEHMSINTLKEKLRGHISGAVAHMNNDEYSGFYPISGSDLKFGSQSIDVDDGVKFLISRLGLDEFNKEIT